MAVTVHTHESSGEGDTIAQTAFDAAATASLSGSVGATSHVDFALTAWAFFPMFHTSNVQFGMSGHNTDGADPDSPRFGAYNNTSFTQTYDVDYRYLP